MRPFAYLRDPLFLVCFSAYWLNRVLANHGMSPPALRSYLNDVICVPFWIPIILWAERLLGLRSYEGPPRGLEIVVPLALWALIFEIVLPVTPPWRGIAVADPADVLCYAAGALGSTLFWHWRYAAQYPD